ncbi:hypothetical protein [Streptomyces sp. SID5910]|uniref:hypothetical protein n=1 Tax=Streptomyces sp. SID5910 TaxID=2690312 RepID=UPI00137117FF|nr:hypothetical protein [Streptomyces sp. SID5910]MYR46749.1 hypothetical protein [Streptomyces sp. SID5910]
MSAPLVVNTKDGACWTRRTVTEGGIALYALADVCSCPEFVMATLDELAGRGIVGSADVLPMPVDPGPVVRPIALHEAQLDALAASGNRAVNDLVHEDLCACDAWPAKCLSSGGYFQGYWDWGYLETAIPAVLGLWESMRGGDRVTELEAARGTVYRAEHPDSGIILGHYSTIDAAHEHCVTLARREGATGLISWVPEDSDPWSPEELTFFDVEYCDGDDVPTQNCTGYVVTPLEVPSEYDAEADE